MMTIVEIDSVWPRIASVVWEMMPPEEVEQMVQSCRFGSALALANEEAVVIVSLRRPGDELELLVWATVGHGTDLTRKHLPALQHVAREVGAHRITFKPMRRGWGRLLGQLGEGWVFREDGMYALEVS